MNEKHYILLYDGVCGFCNSAVQLIIRHDRRKTMQFAGLQSAKTFSFFVTAVKANGSDTSSRFTPVVCALHGG